MNALVVKGHGGGASSLELREVPVPEVPPGHVLIQVARAAINPNDLLALRNAYNVPKPVGAVAGFEGSGKIVAGKGAMAKMMVGRRVAFSASPQSGAWAQYAFAPAMQCVPLRGSITDEQGAVMLTNPLTAQVLISRAKKEGHKAAVQAAAAGALGKMIARLAQERGLPMVHVVRSEAQKKSLEALGVKDVLDSTAPGFEQALKARCHALHATVAFDPVAGDMTGTLLRALDEGGVVRVYGSLSGKPSTVEPDQLVFENKRVEGFTMYEWLKTTPRVVQIATVMGTQGQLAGALATEIRSSVPLADYQRALTDYERAMSGGKILFAMA